MSDVWRADRPKAERNRFDEIESAAVADGTESVAIPRRNTSQAPLTSAQEALWLLDRNRSTDAAYTIRAARRLRGSLNEPALRRAVDLLVERHAALRTTFSERAARVIQTIGAVKAVPLETLELTTLPADAREDAAVQHLQAFAERPFDLERDLLLRALLVRLSPREHVLLLVSHHIVADGASCDVLFRDLAELYAANESGRPIDLPALPIEFADFAAWHREGSASRRRGELRIFWNEQLAQRPPLLALPLDRPREALGRFTGAHRAAVLPETLLDGLVRLGRRSDVTPYMVLLAAYATLLHRYCAQSDVIVGSPFAGREQPELENIVGYFANTLPLRTRFEGDPRFTDVLQAVRTTTLGALEHQDAPYDLLESTGAESAAAPYQTMFILQSAVASDAPLGSLRATPLAFESGVSKFDLTLSVTPWDRALRTSFEYRTNLFEAATIERMLAHFHTLLEGIVADPSRRVSALPLVTAGERAALISGPNATAAEYPRDATLPALIAAQVAARPQACAIDAADRSLTYQELATQAAAVGQRLRALGVRPGVFVGVCLERSAEMLVTLLGVLEAGGAYVPLDPSFPSSRLTFMLRDCGARIVVTQASLRTLVDGIIAAASDAATSYAPALCCIDERGEPPAPAAETAAQIVHAGATDFAYLMYTSGSTGRPKGVAVTHRSLVNLLTSMAREPGLVPSDTLLAVTTLSFDIAALELWLPLVVGARVAIAPREAVMDGRRLAELLSSSGATMMQATPATWRLLLAAGWTGDPNLTVLCGGEALPPDLAAALLPRGRALWNMYGPTETTIWSALQRVRAGEPISLGRPIANTQLYVLEPGGDVAPLGVAGELCIGGDGVSSGYLHRLELTTERFIADPFRSQASARLYRTGDRVRRHPDGRLEYLGRLDDQIKLRGFRIELGEIEAALGAHPRIASAAAAVRGDGNGEPNVVGYYVPHQDADHSGGSGAGDPASLRDHLRGLLPGYMVPAFLVRLDALPLTSNGKVDRAALPLPNAGERVPTRAAFVAPRTAAERSVVGIMSDVLGCAAIGVNDDFFELGGHSLAAMRLLSRVASNGGRPVSLREFFENPTVAGLCAMLERSAEGADALPPITPRTGSGPAPLSYGQELLWLHEQASPGRAVYNMPVVHRIAGVVDVPALEGALRVVVERHAILRARFVEIDGTPMQIEGAPQSVALRTINLRNVPESARDTELARCLQAEATTPFALGEEPPLRALLITVRDADFVLSLVAHHIAFDGSSVDIMWRELTAAYACIASGKAPQLPELPIRYADFAAWQRRVFTAERFDELARYWREHLAGAPLGPALPLDRERPALESFAGAERIAEIPANIVTALEGLARQSGATLFMVLLAAYQTLLHRYSGKDDIVVGSPLAERSAPETSELIGYLTHPLAFRARFAAGTTFFDLLAATKAATLKALEHAAIPLETLLAHGDARGSDAASPITTMFVLNDGAAAPLGLGSASTVRVPFERVVAPFDLSLSLSRGEAGLRAAFGYRTARFEAATIDRMLVHFRTLLASIVADPSRRLSALAIVSADERERLLVQWNDTEANYPREATVADLVAAQAASRPQAIAVVDDEGALTFAELDERAEDVARALRRRGVGPGSFVGVCVGRTRAIAVALWGILKAGGAYVPLDPTFPPARLALMLADCEASIVITEKPLRERIGAVLRDAAVEAGTSMPSLYVLGDDTGQSPPAVPARESSLSATADDFAYVMYTSGSTGRPKGVPISHRALVNFLCSMRRELELSARDTVLAVTTFSFDVAGAELWLALVSGGRLVIAPSAAMVEGNRLADLLQSSGATLMLATPTTWRLLLAAGWRGAPRLTMVSGGEALTQELAAQLLPRGRALYNGYGPTETTIYSAVHRVRSGELMSLGHPVANTRFYVLEAGGEPAPFGVPGELCIGGDGVACGYLHRPELSAERFISDPFRPELGGIYRTGDCVRRHVDGRLEYLGRLDQQVKLRGFRIELGELEAVLTAHPSLHDAAATVHAPSPEHAELVVYYVAEHGARDVDDALSPRSLRAYLRTRLPDYMIPGLFVRLAALPRTPSGKLDRKALPPPHAAAARSRSVPFAHPTTATESVVARIFADVLRRDAALGIDDDFFEAGGHSLLAMQVAARAGTILRTRLSVRSFFATPTVRGVAAALVREEAVRGRIETVARAVQTVHEMAPEERQRRLDALSANAASHAHRAEVTS
ncbi:MAG: amino acid adenylation domain-containing protein [Candidatus Eremiobacteraeota bacterium]|nr:amino acid adenylation domain-containing protein [Candidatus Eremiobacteraeota bacterium]